MELLITHSPRCSILCLKLEQGCHYQPFISLICLPLLQSNNLRYRFLLFFKVDYFYLELEVAKIINKKKSRSAILCNHSQYKYLKIALLKNYLKIVYKHGENVELSIFLSLSNLRI